MRPDRSAAQVLLILYAVSVVLAAPAGVSERYRDALAAEDVRAREDPNVATTAPKTAPKTAPEEDPEDAKLFLNKVLRTKIYRYVILGTIAGTFSGVVYSVQKDIYGSIAPGASTVGRDLAHGDLIDRGVQTTHPQPRKNPVSI